MIRFMTRKNALPENQVIFITFPKCEVNEWYCSTYWPDQNEVSLCKVRKFKGQNSFLSIYIWSHLKYNITYQETIYTNIIEQFMFFNFCHDMYVFSQMKILSPRTEIINNKLLYIHEMSGHYKKIKNIKNLWVQNFLKAF